MSFLERIKIFWAIAKGWWVVFSLIFLGLSGYDLIGGQVPSANLPTVQDYIYWWDWKIWIIIALIIAIIGTVEGAYRYSKHIQSISSNLNQTNIQELVRVELEKMAEDNKKNTVVEGSLENVTLADKSWIMSWSITEMNFKHGHNDILGMLADRASGVPLNELPNRPCKVCADGTLRNQKSKRDY